ncbi:hypothetical protein TL16_g08570 [Triparma laevis f. inornata]|uniref:Uncharacterized protein n=1 Tax=Triparma laevis f. inornata TaxID=1714386 RepID=A0A9W7B5Z7_9STRA|nr:hypothetical protein TL16_g08570 [Triparma laevis f. inornata]
MTVKTTHTLALAASLLLPLATSTVDPAFDFLHCLDDYSEASESECGFMQIGGVLSTLNDYRTCTGWDPVELISALSDAEALDGLEELVAACGNTDDWVDDPTTCLMAIDDAASDQGNPFHTYISEIYEDPDKYCDCNKVLASDLPSCNLSWQDNDIDTNQVLLGSCLFHELCEEFDATCVAIGENIDGCIKRGMDASGAVTDCSESCTADFTLPVGCVRSVIDTDLENDLDSYNEVCGGDNPPSPPSDEDDEEEVVEISFDSKLQITAVPPPFDDADGLATYVEVLARSIKASLGEAAEHSLVVIKKLGDNVIGEDEPVERRVLLPAPEDVEVEFTVTDVVGCGSTGDCSLVDADSVVDSLYSSLNEAVNGGELAETIQSIASEKGADDEFSSTSVDKSSLATPSSTTTRETTRSESTVLDGADEDEDGGGGDISDLVPIDIDFDHCTPDDENVPNCGIFEIPGALGTVQQFSSCTGWDPMELATAVLNSAEIFAEIVAVCSGANDSGADEDCLAAISTIATDSDNPLGPYIGDLLLNPKKYCGCNADFGPNLPSCKAAGQYKAMSCVFAELCSELGQTCDLIVDGVETCMDNSGLNNPGVTDVDCSLSCLSVPVPETCLKDEGDEDADGNPNEDSEFEKKYETYKNACGEGGGGGDDDEPMDFGECSSIYDNVDKDNLPTCAANPALLKSVFDFASCTDWNIMQVLRDFSDGDVSDFADLIMDCSDFAGDGLAKCFNSLAEKSADTTSPVSVYIGDLYNNPDKYCKCNSRLYGHVPDPCMFNIPQQDPLDMGQVKVASCMMGELCEELDVACDELGKHLDEECLPPNKADIKPQNCPQIETCVMEWEGIDSDILNAHGLPTGCVKRWSSDLQERAQAVNWVCWNLDPPDDDGKGGGGYDDDDSSGGSESKVGQTSGAFPPAIYIGAGVLMGVGIIFVVFRKVLQKPKHPQMMRFDSNMGGGGDGITLNELRKGAHGKFSAVVDMDDGGEVNDQLFDLPTSQAVVKATDVDVVL